MAKRRSGTYRIEIDGRWSLEDLGEFPRLYNQVYLAIYALENDPNYSLLRSFGGFNAFSEGGGYSSINLYQHFARSIAIENRIEVKSIHYNSPGWIEILAMVPVAVQVGASIASLAGSLATCHAVYMKIHKGILEIRRLQREERRESFELYRYEQKFFIESSEELATIMKLKGIDAAAMVTRDPVATLKIYRALYTRMEKVAQFVEDGKVRLPK